VPEISKERTISAAKYEYLESQVYSNVQQQHLLKSRIAVPDRLPHGQTVTLILKIKTLEALQHSSADVGSTVSLI
jgi:hypothetical protein